MPTLQRLNGQAAHARHLQALRSCPRLLGAPASYQQKHRLNDMPQRHVCSRRRGVFVAAGKAAAAAAASAATTAAASVATPSFAALQAALASAAPYILMVSACYSAVLVLMMALRPNSRVTKASLRTNNLLVPLALLYGALLVASWQPDTLSLILPGDLAAGFQGGFNPQFFPSLANIITLFSRALTQGSFLLHLMFINVFVARHFYFDGLISRVPTTHTILITAILAPLGVLSHYITKAIYSSSKALIGKELRTRPTNVTQYHGQGIIVLEPYQD